MLVGGLRLLWGRVDVILLFYHGLGMDFGDGYTIFI